MKEFQQAKVKYQEMTAEEKEAIINNITESLMFEENSVRQKVMEYFGIIDGDLEKN